MATVKEDTLRVLKGIDRPISTAEIAKLAKRNPGSVRVTLRILLKEGKITQEFRGHYSYKPTYGVGFDIEPRFQNLFITASKLIGGERIGVKFEHKGLIHTIPIGEDDSQIKIVFGYKRDKISWSVKAPRGLDYYGIELCTRIVNTECRRLGYKPLIWLLRNIEVLRDTESIRLEGIESVTLTDFQNRTMEKYYNKGRGARRELRSQTHTTLTQLTALIYGGQSSYQMLQGLGIVSQKIDGVVETGKNTNRLLVDSAKAQNRLTDAIFKLIDKVG